MTWGTAERAADELVWDIDADVSTGEGSQSDPRQLFVRALESELRMLFLRLAQAGGLVVLAYVSAAHFRPGGRHNRRPRLCVHPSIVVGRTADVTRARGIMAEAYAQWALADLLRDRPRLELEVTTL